LVTQAPADTPARARLDAVAATLDGFELARIDLEQRREGDVLGAQQSGSRSHLRLLKVLRDEAMIESARADANLLLDQGLSEYPALAQELARVQSDAAAEFIDKA
jgi:ATP-dependent DNA helicase RecG